MLTHFLIPPNVEAELEELAFAFTLLPDTEQERIMARCERMVRRYARGGREEILSALGLSLDPFATRPLYEYEISPPTPTAARILGVTATAVEAKADTQVRILGTG